jgi:hypothetical protein
MDYKKLILYFGLTTPVIGVRECLHNWQEGDVIDTDGAKTEIYAVFDRTEKNMSTLISMFKELNTNTAMGGLKNFDPEEDEVWMYGEDEDIVPYMVCNDNTRKKRQWTDYEKMLDYMEECADQIV